VKKKLSGIDRREFALQAALLALSGVTITVSACGGGGGSPTTGTPPPNPPAGSGDEVGTVSLNHGHVAVIEAARLTAGAAYELDISGTSGHLHWVVLSADEIVSIRGGTRVAKTSSTDDGHNHTITFN